MYYTWKKGDGSILSRYFAAREFECPTSSMGSHQRINKELIKRLEIIRTTLNSPLIITSAYRTKEYQEILRQKGYETAKGISTHELGDAADIKNIPGLLEECEKHFEAIGVAKSFIHVDMRQGKKRRWYYT